MERIESVQLGDRTLQALRAAIVNGELAAGEPLLDRQLAERLGVSRTPVREALHRLKEAGLVDYSGRAGWAVSAFTEHDVHELFQLRLLLEPAGLAGLALPGHAGLVEPVVRAFDDFSAPIPASRYGEYFGCDDAFHRAIVAGSGNARLMGFYDVLNAQINRGRHFLLGSSAGRVEETLTEHRAIIDAVRAGDLESAQRALVGHLRTGEELMVRALQARNTADGASGDEDDPPPADGTPDPGRSASRHRTHPKEIT